MPTPKEHATPDRVLVNKADEEEVKVVAMGLFIEQCVRTRLDLIPPGEFIPPRWAVEDE